MKPICTSFTLNYLQYKTCIRFLCRFSSLFLLRVMLVKKAKLLVAITASSQNHALCDLSVPLLTCSKNTLKHGHRHSAQLTCMYMWLIFVLEALYSKSLLHLCHWWLCSWGMPTCDPALTQYPQHVLVLLRAGLSN